MTTDIDDQPVHISDEDFDRVVEGGGVTLVDFWAPWCGPCHAIAPTLEHLAGDYAGRLTVAKVNVDAHRRKAAEYGVRALPTLLLFKGGQPVESLLGVQSRGALAAAIDRILA